MKAKDPVCGMEVETESSQYKKVYKGKTYHFCTPLCMVTFEQEPEKYAQSKKPDGK
ncbi:MAG: YHS domain-containing protein [Melioribacteraceae bacterium]|nr:YHS domain-containing protein [Melioribacteraceae bacterium]GJQ64404.1 MAG: transcriptional regulator [Melioribacteraceae bacterium]